MSETLTGTKNMSANQSLKQFNPYEEARRLLKFLDNKRTKEILVRRFGIGKKQTETLEAIGRDYGISRERVRQIENDGLAVLAKQEVLSQFRPALNVISRYLKQYGGLRRQDVLLKELTFHLERPYQGKGAVCLFLTLGDFDFYPEDEHFYNFWSLNKQAIQKTKQVLAGFINALKQKEQTLPEKQTLQFARQAKSASGLPSKALVSMIGVSRQIEQNVYGDYGLIVWSEVTPKGVKDKAYTVFRKVQKPLHFRQVAELINQANFEDKRRAHPQTVHNELIKDSRFVLVGRGLYALKEWGYQAGTVRDLIVNLVKENGGLPKEKIVKAVMSQRQVRENTILVNLQNRKYFVRNQKGVYNVNEA